MGNHNKVIAKYKLHMCKIQVVIEFYDGEMITLGLDSRSVIPPESRNLLKVFNEIKILYNKGATREHILRYCKNMNQISFKEDVFFEKLIGDIYNAC